MTLGELDGDGRLADAGWSGDDKELREFGVGGVAILGREVILNTQARLADISALVDGWLAESIELEPLPPAFSGMVAYALGWADTDGRRLVKPVGAGKRVRPALVLLTCEALGGDIEDARGAAVAVELLHNFSLVHDDIQDRSDTRRERPTVWRLWGDAQAINVGDCLYALAQVALVESLSDAEHAREAASRLNRACVRLVGGQYLDLALESLGAVTLEDYEQMIAGKTAALLEACAALGALAAGADARTVEACARFGRTLGIAFQYQDDLLGIWGDPSVTGKPVGDDIRARKKSLPIVLGIEASRRNGDDRLTDALARPRLDDAEVERVARLLNELGARSAAEARVAAKFLELEHQVRSALGGSRGQHVLGLCELIRSRVN